MARFFPRDVLLLARLIAVAGAVAWILIGGQAALLFAYAAPGFLLATSVLIWRDDGRRGGAPGAPSGTPALVVIRGLSAAPPWTIANAPDPGRRAVGAAI